MEKELKYIPAPEEVKKTKEIIDNTKRKQISGEQINEKFKSIAGNVFKGVKIGESGKEKLVCDTSHERDHKNIPNLLAFMGLKDKLDEIFKDGLIKEDTFKALQSVGDFFPNLSEKEKINQLKSTDSLLLFVASDIIFANIEIKKHLYGATNGFQNADLATINYYNKLFSAKVLDLNEKISENYYSKITSPLKRLPVDFMKEFAKAKDKMHQLALKEIAEKSLTHWNHNKGYNTN